MPALVNRTRNRHVIGRVKFADSFLARFRGLMFERRAKFNYGLIFEMPREGRLEASIHMLFVWFPIDVVYLSSEKRVVDMKEGLKPWTLNHTPKKPAKFFVELPAGTARAAGISCGDELCWE